MSVLIKTKELNMETNMINIQEREAKQKVCPFLRENCKGSMCLSWKKVGLDFREVLKIKVDLRLTDKEKGTFKTKPLDGILVHIALKKLREEFPDKYVAVKTNIRGDKYVLVNEYRAREI